MPKPKALCCSPRPSYITVPPLLIGTVKTGPAQAGTLTHRAVKSVAAQSAIFLFQVLRPTHPQHCTLWFSSLVQIGNFQRGKPNFNIHENEFEKNDEPASCRAAKDATFGGTCFQSRNGVYRTLGCKAKQSLLGTSENMTGSAGGPTDPNNFHLLFILRSINCNE